MVPYSFWAGLPPGCYPDASHLWTVTDTPQMCFVEFISPVTIQKLKGKAKQGGRQQRTQTQRTGRQLCALTGPISPSASFLGAGGGYC